MSRIGGFLSAAGKGFGSWLAKYVGWMLIASVVTLGGAAALVLFKDWTLEFVLASMMAWPLLGLAMLVGIPMAMLPVGRIYVVTAVAGGLLFNLALLIA